MARWKLFVFGAPRLERDGQPVALSLRKALALLVYLVVTGQPQRRDMLAALLWPESDQQEARGRLRRTLHRLGEALGEGVLAVSADTLGVDPQADLWVDSRAFQQHVAAGLPSTSALEDLSPEQVAHLTEAAALYADDFLAGFTLSDSPAFDDWQFFQREGLRQAFVQVLERLVQTYEGRAAWDEAIGYARRLVSLDPLHEPAQRVLMRLYAWSGQQAAALRQYQECTRVLNAELGVPPDDETTELYEAIRTKRLAPASSAAAAIARTMRAPALTRPLARPGASPVVRPPRDHVHLPSKASHPEQQIRFCTAHDGVYIAYATVGEGPPLVKAANWLSHLEFDWNSPVWRHWISDLAVQHTLVRYDERGCGLSDWNVDTFSVDAWVRDLETVVDALGLDWFPLLGVSQGGAVALTYAFRHPEKVSHLILYGAYARGRLNRSYLPQATETARTLTKLIELGWGQDNPAFRQFFTSLFMPQASAEQMQWFNDLQRVSTSPENAARFSETFHAINVVDLAPRLTVPTLVLHGRDDAVVPFEEGRFLAALIPGARLVPLESKNHILLETEPAWPRFLQEVHRFVAT